MCSHIRTIHNYCTSIIIFVTSGSLLGFSVSDKLFVYSSSVISQLHFFAYLSCVEQRAHLSVCLFIVYRLRFIHSFISYMGIDPPPLTHSASYAIVCLFTMSAEVPLGFFRLLYLITALLFLLSSLRLLRFLCIRRA